MVYKKAFFFNLQKTCFMEYGSSVLHIPLKMNLNEERIGLWKWNREKSSNDLYFLKNKKAKERFTGISE